MTQTLFLYLSTAIVTAWLFQRAGNHESSKRWSNLWLAAAVALPTAVSGLRWGIGSDYFQYLDAFVLIREGGIPRFSAEFGFVALNSVLAVAGFGPRSILVVSALITVAFVAAALMARRDIMTLGFGALTFMLMFYQSGFNTVRMMLAVSVVLYNFINIERRRPVRYLIFGVLAASFHLSAWVMLPLYIPLSRGLGRWGTLGRVSAYAIAILASINIDSLIRIFVGISGLSYYEAFSSATSTDVEWQLWRVLLFVPLIIPGLISYRDCVEVDRRFPDYLSILVVGVIVTLLAYRDFSFVDRVGQYFLISAVLVVPVYVVAFRKAKNYFGIYILTLYLIGFWFVYYVLLNSHQTVPYRSILQF